MYAEAEAQARPAEYGEPDGASTNRFHRLLLAVTRISRLRNLLSCFVFSPPFPLFPSIQHPPISQHPNENT